MTTANSPRPSIDADQIFDREIAPKLDELERERQAVIAKSRQRWLIGAAIFFGTVLLSFLFVPGEWAGLAIGVLVVAAIGFTVWGGLPRTEFVSKIRTKSMSAICASVDGLDYDEEATSFPFSKFEELGLFNSFSDQDLNHHFYGRYRGCEFNLIHAELETGGRNSSTVFDGLCIRISLPRPTRGKVLIYSDLGIASLNNFASMFRSGKRVLIPHADFEQKFEVYAEHPNEALGYITPTFVENFLALSKIAKSENMVAAFQFEWFYLAVNGVPALLDGFTAAKPVAEVRDELNSAVGEIMMIYRIIDQLHQTHPER
jgi:hypothetical protein